MTAAPTTPPTPPTPPTPRGILGPSVWSRLSLKYLPFADAASADLPMSRLLRLSLFKFTMGVCLALMVGTLNRVMIVELDVPAWIVAVMLALPMLVAPFRAVTGYQSDTHRSAFGWKRVPYMWGGTLIQFFGLAIMPFALLVLSGAGAVPVPAWVGQAAAALSFLLVGAGLQTSQTAGLALATDQASEATRPRAVALMYVMLLVGSIVGSIVFSFLLHDFTPKRLIQVVQGTAMFVLIVNSFALWKQEARNPARVAAMRATPPAEPFRLAFKAFIAKSSARRFLWATFFGTMAFNMQDVVLEPYGGEILGLSVSNTSALTGLLAAGALVGFVLAGRSLARGVDPLRLAAYGALVGLPAFSAVVFSAPMQAPDLFKVGTTLIGFGGGLFAVGTLLAAMRLDDSGKVGMALGAWGAVQAVGAGLSIALGGALRDVVSTLAIHGSLGSVLESPVTGYSVVYHLEMLLLFLTLAAIGPIVGRSTSSTAVPRIGLADMPG